MCSSDLAIAGDTLSVTNSLADYPGTSWTLNFRLIPRAGGVRCPALLMRGDVSRGGMLSEEDAASLAALLHDPVRLDFPTAGHLLHWQVRSELAGLAGAFLESL